MKNNKYLDAVNEQMKGAYEQLQALGKETKEKMNDIALIYNENGIRVKTKEVYDQAKLQAEQIKSSVLDNLRTTLELQKQAVKPKQETDPMRAILVELRKMNEWEVFKAKIKEMPVIDLMQLHHDNFLTPEQILFLRNEVMERAKSLNNLAERSEVIAMAQKIKYVSEEDLIDQAIQHVDFVANDEQMFPGMPVSDALSKGWEHVIGKNQAYEVSQHDFFGKSDGEALKQLQSMPTPPTK